MHRHNQWLYWGSKGIYTERKRRGNQHWQTLRDSVCIKRALKNNKIYREGDKELYSHPGVNFLKRRRFSLMILKKTNQWLRDKSWEIEIWYTKKQGGQYWLFDPILQWNLVQTWFKSSALKTVKSGYQREAISYWVYL